jgi:hypothetical protein
LRSVQRWCQYIRQGRELLDDEPGQKDCQLIFSIFKFYHPSRNSLFTRYPHLRRC